MVLVAITINDVAKKAGVSKSTVSQFLNGRYEFMGAETRKRIAAVVEETGYRPNAVARSLKQKKTHTIAAIVSSILNPFMTSSIRGAEDRCKESGFNLILCNSDDDPRQELEYLQTLLAKQIDGIIISTTGRNNEELRKLNQDGVPVVLFARSVTEIGADSVTVDNFAGVRMGIDHLVANGHTRIAFFVLPYSTTSVTPRRERAQAYRELVRLRGLPFQDDWLVETPNDEALLWQKVEPLLNAQGEKPTAFFGGNDLMTMSLVRLLAKQGIRVPGQVAMIGFDEWEWAAYLSPPVTVVAQPSYEMGWKATDILVRRIEEAAVGNAPQNLLYPPELMIRKSCGEA